MLGKSSVSNVSLVEMPGETIHFAQGRHSITKQTGGLARRSESKTPKYLSKNSNI